MDIELARQSLLGEGSDALIAFMAAQSIDLPQAQDTAASKERAQAIGWLDQSTSQLTDDGILASDSCREYLFWKERNKALPFEDALPHVARSVFQDKKVCEIGAGMGANLMSLSTTSTMLCGVEPVTNYVTLGDIFREREGMQPITIHAGGAEDLPFETDELDLVLLVSAHQYFDIHVALKEIARVLKPGGEMILIGGTLPAFVKEIGSQVIAGKTPPKPFVITVVNTLSYTAYGGRIIPSRGNFSTSRPIYPTVSTMVRWMRKAGFVQTVRPGKIENETCFYAKLLDG